MEWGTKNHFVNNAFNCAKEQHDDWIQSVEYYLDMNGYADIFMNPTRYTPVESKILICNRTNDEYVQQHNTIISESKRFKSLKSFRMETVIREVIIYLLSKILASEK